MANGADHWFQRHHGDELDGPIAYFCAEYGLHESLGIYSGGLGRARRRPLKAASDMALPFVGVGPVLPPRLLPPDDRRRRPPGARLPRLRARRGCRSCGSLDARRRAADGAASSCPGATCSPRSGWPRSAACRCCCSTRTCPTTTRRTGPITHILYVRGREMRLHQELVLGVGGVRALRALGIDAGGLAPQRGPLGVHARRAGPRAGRRRRDARRRAGRGQRATACSRSTRRSRPATSGSTRTSSGGSRARCSTATAGPGPAASRSTGCWSWAAASTATRASST